MDAKQKLVRDIDGFRESIRRNFEDLSRLPLSTEERAGIRKNSDILIQELKAALAQLDASKIASGSK